MKKILIAAMLGNVVEWYDYALYGHFAILISSLFFPAGNPALNLMATFGIFAAGFVMRPLGAIIFGYIGDEYGRKKALSASILLMAIPTATIGFLPSYATIGIAAPILLTIMRLLQGLSMGGEFGGSITYLVECAPDNKRGIIGSTSMIGAVGGILLGSLVANLCNNHLSPDAFLSWGWRVSFIVGIFIGFIGFYIRTYLKESPIYEELKSKNQLSKNPLAELFCHNLRTFLAIAASFAAGTVLFHISCTYLTSYNIHEMGLTLKQALSLNIITMISTICTIPISAYLSDRFGRRRILLIAPILAITFSYPAFLLLLGGNMEVVIITQIAIGIVLGLYLGPIPATIVEAFPARIRYSAMSLSYNIAVAIFGGTTPIVATMLIHKTAITAAPAFYVMATSFIGIIGIILLKDNRKNHLAL